MDVLEHISDDVSFMKGLQKYLLNRTVVFVTVPAFQCLFSLHDVQLHHYRRYNYKMLYKTMQASGYDIKNYAYFYLSLIFVRIFSKNRTQNLGMWKRDENNPVTKLCRTCLDIDYFVLRVLSMIGIHIGGLSMFAVCIKKSRLDL